MPTIDPTTIIGTLEETVRGLLNLREDDFPEESLAVVEFARSLRVQADQAEMNLTAYLRAYEQSGKWRGAVDAGNFDSWLKRFEFEPSRYRAGVTVLTEHGLGVCNCITYGFGQMKEVAKLPEEHRAPFIENVLKPARDARSVPVSPRHTKTLVNTYASHQRIRPPTPTTPRSSVVERLEAQIESLQGLLSTLTRERNELRAENRTLKRELSRRQKSVGAAASS
jgi:hypothetical protein